MRNIYAALIVGAALATSLDIAIDFARSMVNSQSILNSFGVDIGRFFVSLLTFTLPLFIASALLMPLLGFFARSNTPRYSIVSMLTLAGILVWRAGGDIGINSHYHLSIPYILGLLSVLLAAWLVTRHRIFT